MIPNYPSTRHWPESLSVHRDDHYHSDPAFFLNKPVIITEKLDGGITQIERGKVYARASSTPTRAAWFDYVKTNTLPKLHQAPENLLIIGEDLYGVHSIEYDPLPDSFFLFHVLERNPDNLGTADTEGDRFWAWDEVEQFAHCYGLWHAPVVYEGVFTSIEAITEWFMTNIKEPSRFGPVCEGFVMRLAFDFPYESFDMATCKFVRANHVQTDQHWTRNWKPARIERREPQIDQGSSRSLV